MSDVRRPCQCGSIDFAGEDESLPYETPRAVHWFDKPCYAKPLPPPEVEALRAALAAARERAEKAERERDEARTKLALMKGIGVHADALEAERDAAREEAADLRAQVKRWEDREVSRATCCYAHETALREILASTSDAIGLKAIARAALADASTRKP